MEKGNMEKGNMEKGNMDWGNMDKEVLKGWSHQILFGCK